MVFNFFKFMGSFFLGSDKNSVTTNENGIWKAMSGIIVYNHNLVKVSDWLTKLIVGVELTQTYNVPVVPKLFKER